MQKNEKGELFLCHSEVLTGDSSFEIRFLAVSQIPFELSGSWKRHVASFLSNMGVNTMEQDAI